MWNWNVLWLHLLLRVIKLSGRSSSILTLFRIFSFVLFVSLSFYFSFSFPSTFLLKFRQNMTCTETFPDMKKLIQNRTAEEITYSHSIIQPAKQVDVKMCRQTILLDKRAPIHSSKIPTVYVRLPHCKIFNQGLAQQKHSQRTTRSTSNTKLNSTQQEGFLFTHYRARLFP